MSLPPAPGAPHPPTPPTRDHSVSVAAAVVMAVLGVLVLVGGVGVLLCGGLGYVMTGGLDSGAGAMLLVALLILALGMALLAVPFVVWMNR